jgi:hypothetical protein
MSDAIAASKARPAPRTMNEALDPAWLTQALRPLSGGVAVTNVEVVEVLRTMATKVRFKASFEGGGEAALCLKAFLDVDAETARGGSTTITEADFYTEIAPRMDVRVPTCVTTVTDRPGQQGVIIMRDLIVDGAYFCSALEPFSADQAAASLEQIARLHANAALLDEAPWIGRRIGDFARNNWVPEAALQGLLDGPRGEGLVPAVRDAGRLLAGLRALAAADEGLPQTLVHGDCHAGNIFRTPEGPGLIDWQIVQRGGWALDVAYHIAAVLPVELAETEEWRLLDHYLETARGLGAITPDRETARAQYRASAVYGYYLWAITRRVDPQITNLFVDRLGKAVTRHDSYRLLGL